MLLKLYIAKQIRFAEKSSRPKWRDLNNYRRFLDKARNDICKHDLFGYRMILPIFTIILLASCSAEIDRKNMLSSDSSVSDAEDFDSEDEEEEVTAVPPTVISGAFLACQPVLKNNKKNLLDVSCHFEKEGEVVEGIDLLPSDLSVSDDLGNELPVSISKREDGTFFVKVFLGESSDIDIAVVSIGGAAVPEEKSNAGDFKISISSEEVSKVEDTFETESTEAHRPDAAPYDDPENYESSDAPTTHEDVSRELSPEQTKSFEQQDGVISKSGSEPLGEEEIKDMACGQLGEPGTWVLVPADADYNTPDFCIMKYEAKKSEGAPVSRAAGRPWTDLTQQEAKEQCASLGTGFHLITNPEWMAVGANIAGQGVNWSRGAVGEGQLARGHSDNRPSRPCPADIDDTKAFVEGSCDGFSQSDFFRQRRTHVLSNGSRIWDLSGNVYEFVDLFNRDDKPSTKYYEYSDVIGTDTMPLKDLVPTNAVKSFWDDSWDSSKSIGAYWPGDNGTNGVLLRGGNWYDFSWVGVFYADLDMGLTDRRSDTGFRCTFSLPLKLDNESLRLG